MTDRTARILIVTRNLPPLVGGMERLNWHIAEELARYAAVRVVGPAGSASLAPAKVKIDEVSSVKMGRYLTAALIKSLRVAMNQRPDVVLAGSGLTAPIAAIVAKIWRARYAVYAHGLDLSVDNSVYRQVWLPFIARADQVIVNSSATRELALQVGVRSERISIVHPGVTLPQRLQTSADPKIETDFRNRHGLGSGKILISVGRLTRRKGILEFVNDVLPELAAKFPDIRFVIVGDAPIHALAASKLSIETIRSAARARGVDTNLVFLGKINDAELAAAYASADVHIFPVLKILNDPEGFGMVAIEAAAHGVPTIAYSTGGVPDAVSEGVSGRLIAPGDTRGFIAGTLDLLNRPLDKNGVRGFSENFSWDKIGVQIVNALAASILVKTSN